MILFGIGELLVFGSGALVVSLSSRGSHYESRFLIKSSKPLETQCFWQHVSSRTPGSVTKCMNQSRLHGIPSLEKNIEKSMILAAGELGLQQNV